MMERYQIYLPIPRDLHCTRWRFNITLLSCQNVWWWYSSRMKMFCVCVCSGPRERAFCCLLHLCNLGLKGLRLRRPLHCWKEAHWCAINKPNVFSHFENLCLPHIWAQTTQYTFISIHRFSCNYYTHSCQYTSSDPIIYHICNTLKRVIMYRIKL